MSLPAVSLDLIRVRVPGLGIALAMLLAACESQPPAGRDAGPRGARSTTETLDTAEGAALFRRWCVPCHGTQGRGDGITASRLDPQPKDLAASCGPGAPDCSRLDEATIREVIAKGARSLGRTGVMPSFRATLAPYQIKALASHVSSLTPD